MSANTNDVEAPEIAPLKLFPSRNEADANKPEKASKAHRVFELLRHGKSLGYVWARGYEMALGMAARRDGYTATAANAKPVSKEAVAAKLAEFSDEELSALGLSRSGKKPVKK